MRVIALSLFFAALCAAQIPIEYSQVLASMASALAENRPELAMSDVSKDMPDYYRLRDNIEALLNQAEVVSSIDNMREENGVVLVDWLLRIKLQAMDTSMEERHETVKIRFGQEGKKKKWKIVSLDPVDFFAPPKLKR